MNFILPFWPGKVYDLSSDAEFEWGKHIREVSLLEEKSRKELVTVNSNNIDYYYIIIIIIVILTITIHNIIHYAAVKTGLE